MDADYAILAAAVLAFLAAVFALPVWALLRTRRISALERRLTGIEAALLRAHREIERLRGGAPPAAPAPEQIEPIAQQPPEPALLEAEIPAPAAAVAASDGGQRLEELIGRNWLGWIGIALILFGAAFFLKYAFENRWIGELGRVATGVLAGLIFVWLGWRRHRAGWAVLARILTAGGVILLYLSTYASYGYYRLLSPTAAFAFLVVLVVQAHLLAVVYRSRMIAVMAQAGGFLTPVLLSTGRDQYVVLFTYLIALNLGVLLVAVLRQWSGVGALSFVLTHLMFWGWHGEHYHPEKLWAAVAFQAAIFALYLAVDVAPPLRGDRPHAEQWARLFVNPFVFFATAYSLLEPRYGDWMGAFALLMAALYAGLARWGLALPRADRRTLFLGLGVSLTFVAIAIPVQLESNWITIAWAAQGVAVLWIANRMRSQAMRGVAAALLAMALLRQVFWDTPWFWRPLFDPVANRFFLSALAVVALLLVAARLLQEDRELPGRSALAAAALCCALGLFWLAFSVETYTYFDAQARALPRASDFAEARSLRWTGQMALSVLWSLYAASLVAAGFRVSMAPLRWLGLGLFLVTVLKAFFVDMAQLEQFYRIVAFLALGLLLLGAAWGYNRIARLKPAAPEDIAGD